MLKELLTPSNLRKGLNYSGKGSPMIRPTDDSFKHSLLGLVELFTQIFGIDKKKKKDSCNCNDGQNFLGKAISVST